MWTARKIIKSTFLPSFFFVRPTYFYHLWKTIDQHYILVSGFKGDWNNPWERQVTFRGWSSIRAELRQKPSHLEFHLWISPIMPASSGSWERPDGFWQERQRVYTHFTSLKLFFFSLKTFNTNLGSQEHLKVCFWDAHNLIKKKNPVSLYLLSVCRNYFILKFVGKWSWNNIFPKMCFFGALICAVQSVWAKTKLFLLCSSLFCRFFFKYHSRLPPWFLVVDSDRRINQSSC